MAFSKCPHCQGASFEIKEVSPQGANFKQNFVQCSACGAPMGVVDYKHVPTLLENQATMIAALQRQVSDLAYEVDRILRALPRG